MMPRKTLSRWFPRPEQILKYPGLRFLGKLIHDPNLFHLNRHSVSTAFFLGLFLAFLPIPGQIPLAAMGALMLRCNLPIAFALVWITNPLTFPFVYYACYQLGLWILNEPPTTASFAISWDWIRHGLLPIWRPLLLGCLICSLFFGCAGYLIIQWSWRWRVYKKWQTRGARQDNQ